MLKSAVEGESEELDMAINLDNLFLQNERGRRRKIGPEIINYWFIYGLCLLALGMLYEQQPSKKKNDEAEGAEEEKGGTYEEIVNACRGLAVTVIPVIQQLSKEKKLVEK